MSMDDIVRAFTEPFVTPNTEAWWEARRERIWEGRQAELDATPLMKLQIDDTVPRAYLRRREEVQREAMFAAAEARQSALPALDAQVLHDRGQGLLAPGDALVDVVKPAVEVIDPLAGAADRQRDLIVGHDSPSVGGPGTSTVGSAGPSVGRDAKDGPATTGGYAS